MAKGIVPKNKKKIKKAHQEPELRFKQAISEPRPTLPPRFVKARYLIVCEGYTEEEYFNLLKNGIWKAELSATKVMVVNPEDAVTIHDLAQKALKIYQKEPFDAVWIVVDNDECNSFKLEANTFRKLAAANLDDTIITVLEKHRDYPLNAPFYPFGKKEAREKSRFFLSENDYKVFLNDIFKERPLTEAELSAILTATTKNNDFLNFYRSAIALESYLHVAYSCIAFEHWLLLHHEATCQAFQNSREIGSYLIEKSYFPNYSKRNYFERYESMMNPARTPEDYEQIYKPFKERFDKYIPILNNILMHKRMHPKLKQQKDCFYEVNPYSSIFELVGKLAGLKFLYPNEKMNFSCFQALIASKLNYGYKINFEYNHASSMLSKELENLFQVHSTVNSDVEIVVEDTPIVTNTLIQPKMKLQIRINDPNAYCVALKSKNGLEMLFIILD